MAIYVLIGLFLLCGSLLGWFALFKTQNLTQQVNELKKEIAKLKGTRELHREDGTEVADVKVAEQASTDVRVTSTIDDSESDERKNNAVVSSPRKEYGDESVAEHAATSSTHESPDSSAKGIQLLESKVSSSTLSVWIETVQNNWMIWLGGICVALSGIFLAKYSIEQGLLGPSARIGMGIVFGLALHLGAEYLRRKQGGHQALAALAAGGSITLFAAILSALHLYQLLDPKFVFVLLALVAMMTMVLAYFHGPVLAIIGILGAYLVPILVGGNGGDAPTVLSYILIISASALFLLRYVYRNWLWAGVIVGCLAWWLLTLGSVEVDGWRGIYLAIVAYLLIAIPEGNWLLGGSEKSSDEIFNWKKYIDLNAGIECLLPLSLFLICIAQAVSISLQGFENSAIGNWSALTIILLFSAGKKPSINFHPWLLLVLQLCGWLISQFNYNGLEAISADKEQAFYSYCAFSSVLYALLAMFNFKRSGSKNPVWVSLGVISPLLFLALSYLLSADFRISLQWGLIASVLAGCYLTLAMTMLKKQRTDLVVAWLFIGSHLGYSLAVAMFLREASMTLALAVQVISLSWVIKTFNQEKLSWLLKAVVAVVILRLSLNPWIVSYTNDVHWSLWTYGGSTLCCFAAVWILRKLPELQKWAFAASLHLLALTIWTETRYWLYDGDVYANTYDLIEAALNVSIFASLGLVYYFKQQASTHLRKLYDLYSKILLGFALVNYLIIVRSTALSSSWIWASIGETKVFNLMLLAYGAPVLLGYLLHRFYLPQFSRIAAIFTAIAGFIFISLQIRHFWHGEIRLWSFAYDGELYTYSAVWLLIAIAAVLGGARHFGKDCYKAGMVLLALVIAKLFLIDMSDLEGLYRVTSFMGMGLALLGIAYLHQRFAQTKSMVGEDS